MPHPHTHLFRRPQWAGGSWVGRVTRWSAFGLVAGLGIIPIIPVSPSMAAVTSDPGSPCGATFTASAASDLATLRQRENQPMPRATEQPSDLLGAASRAGLYGGKNPLTAARAGTFAPRDAQPTHILQVAPPTQATTVTASVAESDDTGIRVGARDLKARAVLSEENNCADAWAESVVSVQSDSVFTGPGGPTIRIPAGARTHTITGFVSEHGKYSALALAAATVPDLEIFNGITVRVTSGPALRITASGDPRTSKVSFTAPKVSIATPRTATEFHDLTAPLDFTATEDPEQIAAVLSLLGTLGETGLNESPLSQVHQVLLVRLTPGDLVQQNRGWVVHALATTVRVTVVLREMATSGTVTDSEVAEISVGCLEALARAPEGGYPGRESSPRPMTPRDRPGSGAGSGDRRGDPDFVSAARAPLEPAVAVTSPGETTSTAVAARPTIPMAPSPPEQDHSVTMNSAPRRSSLAGCLIALAIGACGMYGLWRRRMGSQVDAGGL